MRTLVALALLTGCIAFVGCGGVKELGPTDGSDVDLQKVQADQDKMMKEAMEKYKTMEAPGGTTYSK